MSEGRPHRGPQLIPIDVREHGAKIDGEEQAIDRRLFMQLLVFQAPSGIDTDRARDAFVLAFEEERGLHGVLYADVNDPRSFGLLTWSEDPAFFVDTVRPMFRRAELRDLVLRDDMTMFGRTYSTGHERDLAHWILKRPIENVTDENAPWAVWYPLRRNGDFEKLEGREKGSILMEHATIGRSYGALDLAHDVRLACHGIDKNDNEFVIGLVGKTLHPLSHVVHRMRSTIQTSTYISQMGPFFVGKAIHMKRGAETSA